MTQVYKRQYRDCPEETKQKLSQNSNLRKPRPEHVKQKISTSMKTYWQGVPSRPKSDADMLRDGDVV